MGKFSNQTHLAAIRDAFALLTPLIIASAIASILAASVFANGGSAEHSSLLGVFARWSGSSFYVNASGAPVAMSDPAAVATDWGIVSKQVYNVLYNMQFIGLRALSLYFVVILGFFLSKARGNNAPEIGAIVALGCFMIATAGGSASAYYVLGDGSVHPLSSTYIDSNGLFCGLLVTIGSIELYSRLSKVKKFEINLPPGVPPAIARGFAKLIPIILTVGSISLIWAIIAVPTALSGAKVLASVADSNTNAISIVVADAAPGSFYNIGDLIFMGVQAPFIYAATIQGANLAIGLIFALIVGLLWFFGLHGVNVAFSIFLPVLLTLVFQNNQILQTAGADAVKANGSIFNMGSFGFLFIGGSGATLPLLLSTFIFGKRANERELARYSLPAGVFSINEPVVFGYPLVLNPLYAIPFIFTMPILAISTWLFYQAFDTLPPVEQFALGTPTGLDVLFATHFDYSAYLIYLINFAISFAVWTPFVFLSNSQGKRAAAAQAKAQKA